MNLALLLVSRATQVQLGSYSFVGIQVRFSVGIDNLSFKINRAKVHSGPCPRCEGSIYERKRTSRWHV